MLQYQEDALNAKAAFNFLLTLRARRYRDQTGLDTPVVYTVNYEYYVK